MVEVGEQEGWWRLLRIVVVSSAALLDSAGMLLDGALLFFKFAVGVKVPGDCSSSGCGCICSHGGSD